MFKEEGVVIGFGGIFVQKVDEQKGAVELTDILDKALVWWNVETAKAFLPMIRKDPLCQHFVLQFVDVQTVIKLRK